MSAPLLPVWMAAAYMLAHLPVFALGRFSVILIPALVASACAGFFRPARARTGQERARGALI
jgi:hypothetical protein